VKIHAEWEGKILGISEQTWLILRRLQPAKAGYEYNVYNWQPPNNVILSGARKAKIDMRSIAQAIGIPLTYVNARGRTANRTTTQLGNVIWEMLSLP